jgi:hypothetical protein
MLIEWSSKKRHMEAAGQQKAATQSSGKTEKKNAPICCFISSPRSTTDVKNWLDRCGMSICRAKKKRRNLDEN